VLIALHVCYLVKNRSFYCSKCIATPTAIVLVVVPSNEGAHASKLGVYFHVEYAFSNTFLSYKFVARMTLSGTNLGKKKGRIPNLVQSRSLKPRGEPNGPKRTLPDLGDKWQHIIAFGVKHANMHLLLLLITSHLNKQLSNFGLFVRQIMADKMIKNIHFFESNGSRSATRAQHGSPIKT